MAIQVRLEHFGETNARFFVRHGCETRVGPGYGITFDYEGTGRPIEFVRVRGEHAGRCFPKSQCQSMEQPIRAVPDVFVGTDAKIRLEVGAKGLPDSAIHTVRAYQQFAIVFERFKVVNFIPKPDLNAMVFTSLLQDLE